MHADGHGLVSRNSETCKGVIRPAKSTDPVGDRAAWLFIVVVGPSTSGVMETFRATSDLALKLLLTSIHRDFSSPEGIASDDALAAA